MKPLPVRFMIEGQVQHILLLAGLVPGALSVAAPALDGSMWLGIADTTWLYAVVAVAVLHQALGWFVFRAQLVFALFTRLFGRYDLAVWGGLFFPFLLLRPLKRNRPQAAA